MDNGGASQWTFFLSCKSSSIDLEASGQQNLCVVFLIVFTQYMTQQMPFKLAAG